MSIYFQSIIGFEEYRYKKVIYFCVLKAKDKIL